MTARAGMGYGVRRPAFVDRASAYKCSACGTMHRHEDEAQRHRERFEEGCWEALASNLTPMRRDDGIVHLASYYWLTGPTLTWRAICDGHPVWIVGGGDKVGCELCAESLAEVERDRG